MNGPAVILVNPQMGENIGAAARAMLNCGLTDLRLVSPRDGWPNEAALANASGAAVVIEQARLYSTLAEAVADRRLVIATTSRDRDMTKPVLSPETAADAVILADRTAEEAVSAFVFGPERSGLTNDDLTYCDAIMTVPLNPDYASLNIAQAVLLVAYQWHRRQSDVPGGHAMFDLLALSNTEAATKEETENLMRHLSEALAESGFFTSEHQQPAMLRNMRNMIQRMRMTSQETQSFHGMIKSLRGKNWTR